MSTVRLAPKVPPYLPAASWSPGPPHPQAVASRVFASVPWRKVNRALCPSVDSSPRSKGCSGDSAV